MSAKKQVKTAPKTRAKKTAKKPPAAKRGRGRPKGSNFHPIIAAEICRRLANGEPLATMCRENKHFPCYQTVYNWMNERPDFLGAIARARVLGFDVIAADCLRIADTQEAGETVKDGPDGQTITTEDMLGHRKLQIETRLKLLSKWDPKRYGDKLDVTTSGEVKVKIVIGGNVDD